MRRAVIPNLDGGELKLGIPTVIDRIIQKAVTQILTPIYEPIFAEESFGYRPGGNPQKVMQRVKKLVDEGFVHVSEVDLSKHFDTINYELLMNIIREQVKDKKVIDLIKKYLKRGVMI